MEREYDKRLDGKGAIRAGHAYMRELLADATAAVKRDDWLIAQDAYNDIMALASSLAQSAQVNSQT